MVERVICLPRGNSHEFLIWIFEDKLVHDAEYPPLAKPVKPGAPPVSQEEAREVEAYKAALAHGEGISHEIAEFGLSSEDLYTMTD